MFRGTLIFGVAAATIFLCNNLRAGVSINEVGYYMDRSGDTGKEWIELYNSGPEPRDLSGWDLYPGRSPHFIFPQGFVLESGRFVLVRLRLEGTNTDRVLYEGTAGISANMPNTKGSVALFTSASRDTIVDFMQYGEAGQIYQATAAAAGIWTAGEFVDTVSCGWSLGLRADGADSNRPADWQAFPQPTPGYSNVPPPFDVELLSLSTAPFEIPADRSFDVLAEVANSGQSPATRIEVVLFEDSDGDSLCHQGEKVWGRAQAQRCSTSVVLSFSLPGLPEGHYRLAALATCSLDQYAHNNYRTLTLVSGRPLAINEIMYAPPSGQAEWVEIYNRSAVEISLKNWTIEDASAQRRMIDTVDHWLRPGEFGIITSNALQPPVTCLRLKPADGWPSLNNDQDLIVLRDGRGAIVDQVHYFSSWGGSDGRSLERVNPFLDPSPATTWGGSVSDYRSTPGAVNSIYIDRPAAGAQLAAAPNPFSPDGDGHQDRTIIFFTLPWPRSQATIKIFDRLGRLVRTLAANKDFSQQGSLVWDGRDDGGRLCPLGQYIVLLEAREINGGGSLRQKKVVVISGRL